MTGFDNLNLNFDDFVLMLNVPVNNFFSHVGTDLPLPGYYQYFSGSKCANLLKDTTRRR